jgi:hypothetical protein
MLLTKPLSTFLNANRSPHIHTLFLVTPAGKLLSSSSSAPATLLRNQATIACSVWELYHPITTAGTISASLPSLSDSDSDSDKDENLHQSPDPAVSSILIQLETGTMVIRALRCSLLFVVIGPSPAPSTALRGLTQGVSYLSVQSAASPPTSSHSQTNGDGAERRLEGSSAGLNGLGGGGGAAPAGTSIKVVKRLAEELAKCLDVELEGFTLSSGL